MSTNVRVQLRCNLFGTWAMIRLMIVERLDEQCGCRFGVGDNADRWRIKVADLLWVDVHPNELAAQLQSVYKTIRLGQFGADSENHIRLGEFCLYLGTPC